MNFKSLLFLGVGSRFTKELLEKFVNSNLTINRVVTIKSFQSEKLIFNRKIDIIELDFYEINKGIYPNLNYFESPIDVDMFNVINKDLLNILKIMDRLDIYKYYKFDKRVSLVFDHLKFWYNLLLNINIDLVISTDMPHEAQDYIAYLLAEHFNIKKCFLVQSQIPQFYQILENIEINDLRLSNYDSDEFNNEIITSDLINEYYHDQMRIDHEPFYMKNAKLNIFNKLKIRIKKIILVIKNIFVKKLYKVNYLIDYLFLRKNFGNNASKNLKEIFLKKAVTPSLNKKYIYVPLHFQPERTTAPQGGLFAFQELMIEMLSKAIPEDWYLYIKEHPKQEINGRNIEYYDNINKLEKIVFIDNKIKSLELIQKSICVATVTGTAGWEAVCFEKPVLLFGNIFFQYAPGVFKINNNMDLAFSIKKILQNETGISKQKLIKFLNCVYKYSYHGFSDELYFPLAKISWEKNLNDVNKHLNDFILNA